MVAVHLAVGIAVIAGNLIAGGWGGIAWLRQQPSVGFWYALRVAQAAVVLQVGLGVIVGGTLAMVNGLVGPRRPSRVKSEPYECGLPSEVSRTFRFGVSFYMIAMLFILFDIEVVFLYPVGVILRAAHSVFVLVEVGVFVVLLLVALAYVWRRGALDWR